MAEIQAEKSYSAMERIMFFLTPILFTLVLLGVLLALFNIDLRNRLLDAGNKVPLLEKVLPDASKAASTPGMIDETIRSQNNEQKIRELEKQLAAKISELAALTATKTTQEQTIADLQSQLEQSKATGAKKQLDDQEYQNRITGLASMFGDMTPGRAAPILQSMTLDEMVLIMDAMSPASRIAVMEKMTPQIAADATALLKDTIPVKDRQISALQARLKQQMTATAQSAPFLDAKQLSATFNSMAPAKAAELLLQMAEVSPSKVLQVLNSVSNAARSSIVAEMSTLNQKYTAQLVAKLMSGK
ncbi:MgtE protein [Paenibacillus darwinianus]|uniref:MgtE protein n=1 Tax=Paenibacillus darwinianus TaxID=1380763 RepID=A0A9W5S3I4_9BACL|nr:MgtE protein [Paenibacillus darwinianus]EXX91330.1 MgtE protein [Paenibacillus darwinianus]EXX92293.1 MgtE protein [Paenibacillus darwinianus]EXX92830.1 MgtE protein [Paenibacillus darwinianus]